jgi:hypothetical protein
MTFAPFPPHLWRVARGEVLHVDGCGDHGAGDAEALADVAFHLRAEDHLGRRILDGLLDLEVIVGDQRLDPELAAKLADGPRELAVVAAKTHDLEPHLVPGDARGGFHMGGVPEQEDALAGEIRGIN